MQFPESWLRTMVDPTLTTEALAHLLTMSGLEVEAIVPVAPQFEKVVVAQVLAVASASQRRQADRLHGRYGGVGDYARSSAARRMS